MLNLRRVRSWIFGTAVIAVLGLASVLVPAAAGSSRPLVHWVHPGIVIATPIVYQGNFPANVATLEADNTGGGYGLIGTGNSQPGVFGTSNTGSGLVGLSTARYGIDGSSINSIGLNGFSQNNIGLAGSGPSAAYPLAGVYGTSGSGSGNATGVYGTIGQLGFGVIGECANAQGPNVRCTGILGQSLAVGGIGVWAYSGAPNTATNPALQVGSAGAPLISLTNSSSAVVGAVDNNGLFSLSPSASGGINLSASGGDSIYVSNAGNTAGDVGVWGNAGSFALVGEKHGNSSYSALYVSTDGLEASGSNTITVHNFATATDIMTLDNNGNIHIPGKIYTSGFCAGGCIVVHGSGGEEHTAYSPGETTRTLEDFGQGQIINGQGYVRLDPTYASTLDPRASYLVFITPDGDNNGLFVTQKTSAGFVVRESRGGHSTLAFDYRIVGKPRGMESARLPLTKEQLLSTSGPPVRTAPDARRMLARIHGSTRPINTKPHRPLMPQPY
jgi:hypothetical protein